MREKSYLIGILKIVESKNGLRKQFYRLVFWTLLGLLVLYGVAQYRSGPHSNALFFLGMIFGIFSARVETFAGFKYLIPHISVESLKARLADIQA